MAEFNKLKDFMESDDPFIQELGRKAKAYTDAYDQGRLSSVEYQELMEDLTDLERINYEAQSMEHKAQLEKAVRALLSILKMGSKFI
jgi:hypothetical protein